MKPNYLLVDITEEREYLIANSVFQWDHGLKLKVRGLFPSRAAVNVIPQFHFSNDHLVTAYEVVPELDPSDGMTLVGGIPDVILMEPRDFVCYIYNEEDDHGITEYVIKFKLIRRQEPSPASYTPEQINNYDILVSTLTKKIQDAEAWANGTRDGIPIGPTKTIWVDGDEVEVPDEAYKHNSRYWRQWAEAWANGNIDGAAAHTVDPETEDPLWQEIYDTTEYENSYYWSRVSRESAENALESERLAAEHMSAAKDAQLAAEFAQMEAEEAQALAEFAQSQSEAARDQSEAARDDAINARNAAETAQVFAEEAREGAEEAQRLAEIARGGAETAQTLAEDARDEAVEAQLASESAQRESELARDQSITAQHTSETARDEAREAQTAAETAQYNAETAKVNAEIAQQMAEDSALDAENARLAAELAQRMAENAQAGAESAQAQTEDARDAALAAQTEAKTAQRLAEEARDDSQLAQRAAEEARDGAEEAEENARAAENRANESADIAQQAESVVIGLKDEFENLTAVAHGVDDVSPTVDYNQGVFDFGIPYGQSAQVEAQETYYQISGDSVNIPTGTWSTSPPDRGAGDYLWCKNVLTWNSGATSVFYTSMYVPFYDDLVWYDEIDGICYYHKGIATYETEDGIMFQGSTDRAVYELTESDLREIFGEDY